MLLMFLDLTVVYFAFGAPVGVYQITRNRRRTLRTTAVAFLHFVLWPLAAAASLRRSLIEQEEAPQLDLEGTVDAIRADLEAAIHHLPLSSRREIREAFDRYTCLAIARTQMGHTPMAMELLAIAGRENDLLAAPCLDRRNRRKLELHLLNAKNEFNDAITELSTKHANLGQMAGRLDVLLDAAD